MHELVYGRQRILGDRRIGLGDQAEPGIVEIAADGSVWSQLCRRGGAIDAPADGAVDDHHLRHGHEAAADLAVHHHLVTRCDDIAGDGAVDVHHVGADEQVIVDDLVGGNDAAL